MRKIVRFIKGAIRNRRKASFIDNLTNLEWFEMMKECQKEIAASDPDPYYLEVYMDDEILYWSKVPQWIAQLKGENANVRRILDIGGAYGTLVLYCKQLFACETFMTDLTERFLSRTLRDKYKIHFSVNNVEFEPVHWQQQFDIIIFTEVLEHLNFHPKPTLMKIREHLSDGGKFFLTTPDAAEWGRTTKYYKSLNSIPHPCTDRTFKDDHIWQYNREELTNLLAESGFIIEKLDYAPGTPNRHFNVQLSKR